MAGGLHTLPAGLPAPLDDGATAHLPGAAVPAVTRPATSGRLTEVRPRMAAAVPAWLRERRA